MKILFSTGIYPPDAGGPATYTRSMARAFVEMGYGVEVVCYTDGVRGMGIRDQGSVNEQFLIHRISRGLVLPLRYLAFAWKVFVRARKMNADIVYLQGPVSEGLPGMIGAKLAGKKTVMKVVGDYAWEQYQGTEKRREARGEGRVGAGLPSLELLDEFITHRHEGKIGLLEKIERWTAKRADRIITPSRYLKGIVEKWGVPSDRIEVIENAIESLPNDGRSRDDARRDFGVADCRVILLVARSVPWKHGDFLIRLLPKLASDAVLVIAGDGPALDSWKKEAETSGVSDRVKFLGRLARTEVANWLRASDAFVLPSGYEGFPHVVPEAASVGLPCFVSDKGGNPETRELIGDQVTILPYLDEAAWVRALSQPFVRKEDSSLPHELEFPEMVRRTLQFLSAL